MSALAAAAMGGSVLAAGLGTTAAIAAGAGTALVAGAAQNKAKNDAKDAQQRQLAAANQLASQADRSAELSYQLGQDQLSFARQQYDELSPLTRRISEGQIAAQDEQLRQARDYYDYMTGTFRPIEQGLVQRAQEFNTDEYRNQLARQASEDAANAFRTTLGALGRDQARRGVAPGSGNAMAMENLNALGLASTRTGAMTGTRERAEQMGYARMLDAVGIGRGLSGASAAAYAGATGAGSAGLSSAAAPGQAFVGNISSAANTMLAGSGQAIGAYGNLYSGATNMAMGAQDNLYGLQGALLGTAGTIGAGMLGRKT